MKRGFRALAVLAAIAVASAGPQVFAVCAETGGFAIFQCADRAYFEAPPAGSGGVSATFWQIGFGNGALNTGLPGTSTGTGMTGPATFNGNDSGIFAVDLVDAQTAIGNPLVPAGAVCLRNNNWGNAGIDGCCDNWRTTLIQMGNDDILNPEYHVYYARAFGYYGYASLDWVQDYPTGVLLTESGGHYFAAAAVASMARTGPTDVRPGYYNFRDVNNGSANPITAENNIVPWQRVPGDRDPADPSTNFVVSVSEDPITHDRTLGLAWNGVVVHNDASVRPSTNPSVAGGAGVADLVPAGLVRYVVETQGIVDGGDPIGSLDPGGWTAVHTTTGTSATVVVAPDTCVRLHTFLGRVPQTSTHTIPNCRLAKCGDLGYDVAGTPACVGGPLVADGTPKNVNAVRGRGNIRVSWDTDVELSVSRFDVFAVKKGDRTKVAERPCAKCTSGEGASYSFDIPAGKLKGARMIEIVAVGPNTKSQVTIK
jgi:hypothetical protein